LNHQQDLFNEIPAMFQHGNILKAIGMMDLGLQIHQAVVENFRQGLNFFLFQFDSDHFILLLDGSKKDNRGVVLGGA
jgi:hypothetical protein